MNKFYPFYFHFYTKKRPETLASDRFLSEFRFLCEIIYIGNQPHFE